ncbi:MAG: nucleoside-diphosphate kinase [Candidatus Thermoplasmatota archaeon]|nr:nucleoside-diphosphate kinase [Candidatus Thermoplasmatota archaeon]
MESERTLVLIKPDGVNRRLSGEIISRFERKGLKIVALKLLKLDRAQAEKHYSVHRDKPFFGELVQYITSSPIIAMVLEGRNCITTVRTLCGATDGSKAAPGTIRGDFSNSIQNNIVHASDSDESYRHEVSIYFNENEILTYQIAGENLI